MNFWYNLKILKKKRYGLLKLCDYNNELDKKYTLYSRPLIIKKQNRLTYVLLRRLTNLSNYIVFQK